MGGNYIYRLASWPSRSGEQKRFLPGSRPGEGEKKMFIHKMAIEKWRKEGAVRRERMRNAFGRH
jgi:hypothetical protein